MPRSAVSGRYSSTSSERSEFDPKVHWPDTKCIIILLKPYERVSGKNYRTAKYIQKSSALEIIVSSPEKLVQTESGVWVLL